MFNLERDFEVRGGSVLIVIIRQLGPGDMWTAKMRREHLGI